MNNSEFQEAVSLIKELSRANQKYSILYKQSEIVRVSEIRYKQLQLIETFVCILAFTGFGSAAMVSDLTYTDLPEKSRVLLVMEVICTVSTLLLIFAIFCRVKQEFLWNQAKGIYSYMDTLESTGKLNYFYLEAAVNIIHTPVGIGNQSFIAYNAMVESDIEYAYTTIITAFMVIRIYHLIRVFSILSIYRSPRSQRLCQMNGSFADMFYAGKCMMQERPVIVMIWMLLTGIFVFGFLLRLFERPASSLTLKDLNDYGNAMWCIITTMTTVGYGDYYPVTMPGRVCGCCACIWGVLVVSFMCCSLYNLLLLDTGESKSLLTLHRLWYKDEIKESAAMVLTSVGRYKFMLKNKQNFDYFQLEIQLGKVRRFISEFQRARNKQRTLYNYDSYNEILEYKLDEIVGLEDTGKCDQVIEEILMKIKLRASEEGNII